tara:strand:+ start:797 stop:904 length:108 start_codon:yes stop_codon:yes gene_type:complete
MGERFAFQDSVAISFSDVGMKLAHYQSARLISPTK